ncbi:hypothetical protein AGMMS50262_11990 [Bacteroidia bacterium]|nr:hypothetical protein AGMMS50262_11990 [Bacteroidia bacterium]
MAVVYLLLLVCGGYACASIGTPEGGDYDVEPPQFVGSNPPPNTTNFDKNKISLFFNEYIAIDNPSTSVIITPPQKRAPKIQAIGKKVSVELRDSLLPNTTYTFDFTNGIVDNNEQNALEGLTFAFSTGDVVDSLVISGRLLNAENLEPMPNIMVGIHSDLSDTAFTTLPFLRTSQTNELGKFWIRNVAPGAYRLFALNDANRDFKFDSPEEMIAFDDSLIIPSFEPAVRMDTIWKDSLTVDSLIEVHYTRFTPDNVILRLFKEDYATQYLTKSERTSPQQFVLTFNAGTQKPPAVYPLEEEENTEDWIITEQSPDRKIWTYWMKDSLLYQKDTLKMVVNYEMHDTLHHLVPITDTLRLVHKKTEVPKKGKEKDAPPSRDFLKITVSPSGTMEVYDTLKFTFSEPVEALDTRLIHIRQKVDTLFEDRDFRMIQNSLNPRVFYVDTLWNYEQEYQITIDSASIFSIYGKENDSTGVNIKVKKEDDYRNLYVKISGITGAGFGQLLNENDQVVRQAILEDGELAFEDLKPDKYYLRYIEDTNGNGQWDTGNYAENRQPENVYYYPAFFEIKSFWADTESWDVTKLPLDKQKPLPITKNKPKEKKPKRENTNQQNVNQRNTNNPNNRMPAGRGTQPLQAF